MNNSTNVQRTTFNTKKLAFAAMALALATVASFFKLFEMPMGGSITLFSMLFIVLIGYWFGPKLGLATGAAYGLLALAIEPVVLTIPQVLLDYPLACGALGLSGFFRNKKHGLLIGYLVAVLGKYFFVFLSGYIFFGIYAPEGWSPAIYSLTYNGAYMGGEALLTLIILSLPPVKNAIDWIGQTITN